MRTPDIEDHPSLEESECAVATEEDPVDDPDDPPEYDDEDEE